MIICFKISDVPKQLIQLYRKEIFKKIRKSDHSFFFSLIFEAQINPCNLSKSFFFLINNQASCGSKFKTKLIFLEISIRIIAYINIINFMLLYGTICVYILKSQLNKRWDYLRYIKLCML